MTEHNVCLESKQTHITHDAWYKIIRCYIPTTLFEKVKLINSPFNRTYVYEDDDLVCLLLDNSNGLLRMYGSAAELWENLKMYRHSSIDTRIFGFDICEPYSAKPNICKGLKTERYITKHDVFVHMQNLFLNKYEVISSDPVGRAFLILFLKVKDIYSSAANEYISCSNEFFTSIEKELVDSMNQELANPTSTLNLSNYTYEEIFGQFKSLLPMPLNENQFRTFTNVLAKAVADKPPKQEPDHYFSLHKHCTSFVKVITAIINARPTVFQTYLRTMPKPPLMVRCFEDNGNMFIPIDEMPPSLQPLMMEVGMIGSMSFYWNMMDANKLMEYIENNPVDFEVIFYPIVRTKHRAIFVANIARLPHIMACDALFEVLYEWMFSVKLFQRIRNTKEWKSTVGAFFDTFSLYFNPDKKNIFFISIAVLDQFNEWSAEIDSKFENRPAKDVRDARKDGFTEKDLKIELKRLGLNAIFPDIMQHTKIVYAHVCSKKKQSVLRTCDLYDAIYNCMLIAFFKKFTKLIPFIHNQNGCHRVLDIDCSCKTKNHQAPKTKGTNSNFVEEEVETSQTSKASKTQKKKETQKKPTPEKESENCEKCFRTSQLCQKTKEMLADQKINNKTLEKELENWKKKVESMEKLVKELEENAKEQKEEAEALVAVLQNELKTMQEQLEDQSKEHLEMLLSNAQKDEIIRKLEQDLAELRAPKRSKLSSEMRRILIDLQDKLHLLESENLLENATAKQCHLNSISKREPVKQMARIELMEFKEKYAEYEKAIQTNINIIQGNVSVTQADLLPVPEKPALSELFEQEYLLAEQENEKLDEECLICLKPKSSTRPHRLFKCPNCPVTYHSNCISSWVTINPTCPSCRHSL